MLRVTRHTHARARARLFLDIRASIKPGWGKEQQDLGIAWRTLVILSRHAATVRDISGCTSIGVNDWGIVERSGDTGTGCALLSVTSWLGKAMDRTRLFREYWEKETHAETRCTSIRYDSDRGIYDEIWEKLIYWSYVYLFRVRV